MAKCTFITCTCIAGYVWLHREPATRSWKVCREWCLRLNLIFGLKTMYMQVRKPPIYQWLWWGFPVLVHLTAAFFFKPAVIEMSKRGIPQNLTNQCWTEVTSTSVNQFDSPLLNDKMNKCKLENVSKCSITRKDTLKPVGADATLIGTRSGKLLGSFFGDQIWAFGKLTYWSRDMLLEFFMLMHCSISTEIQPLIMRY